MHGGEMHHSSRRLWMVSGTGEGPLLARQLLAMGWQLTVSVVTPAAALAYAASENLTIQVGALAGEAGIGAELAAAWASGQPYAVVVDASHPFASQVSRDLAAVCRRHRQRLLRLLRPALGGAATVLDQLDDLAALPLAGEPMLLAIGARQLATAMGRSRGARHHARLLPSASALQQAMAAGLEPARVACLRPGAELEVERALVRRWGITTVLARQSGGGTEQLWHDICAREGARLLLLRRPDEPAAAAGLELDALLATLAAQFPAHR